MDDDTRLKLEAFASELLDVTSSVASLTGSVFMPGGQAPAKYAELIVTTNNVYISRIATTPDNTCQTVAASAAPVEIWGLNNIRNVRLIRVSADAKVRAIYYH